MVGTRGRLGATAPRTAGAACRPACAPASPFPTRAWPARESWRKDGCAIGRLAIVSGGMFPCTRGAGALFPGGGGWPHPHKEWRVLQRLGEAAQGLCWSSKPRGTCGFGCAWPCPSPPVSHAHAHVLAQSSYTFQAFSPKNL